MRKFLSRLASLPKFQLLGLLFLLLVLPLLLFAASQKVLLQKKAAEPEITSLTNQLVQTAKIYNRLPASQRSKETKLLNDLIAVAINRKRLLLEEIKKNPGAFLEHTLPTSIRNSLPDELKNRELIEREIEIKGKLTVFHFDDFENRRSKTAYRIDSISVDKGLKKFYNLYFTKDPPTLLTDSMIIGEGISLDSELVLDSKSLQSVKTLNINPPVTTGDFKMIVLMFNFTNYRIQPFTREQIISTVFTDNYSVDRFYQENSFNQTSFSGDVSNWFELDVSNNNCDGNFQFWAEKVKAMATAQGHDLPRYDRIAYLFPAGGDCSWGGIAGTYEIWINGMNLWNIPDSGTFIHELGHTFGLAHSNLITCGNKAIDIYSNCQVKEYWDRYDRMGIQKHHFNAAHKIKLGWIPQARILEATMSGTYSLSPLEVSGNGYQALRIRKLDTDQYYYLEYRQPIGFDRDLPGNISNTLIHIFSETNPFIHRVVGTFLIDTTPNSAYGADEALMDGASFFDEINNIRITQISHNQNNAVVSIVFPSPRPTLPNKALYLDGNSYMLVADDNKTLILTPNFTLEAWIKPDPGVPNEGFRTIISRYFNIYPDKYIGYLIYTDPRDSSSDLRFGIGPHSGATSRRFPADEWTHVALVRNGNKVRLYINGQFAKEIDLPSSDPIPANPSDLFYLGVFKSNVTAWEFKGAMDEFRASNVSRNIEENWRNGAYFQPLSLDENTLALWRFENNLQDSSSNRLDGIGVGKITYTNGIVSVPLPDLTVSNLQVALPKPVSEQRVKATADIINKGEGEAGGVFTTGLYVRKSQAESLLIPRPVWQKVDEVKIDKLKTGEVKTIELFWTPGGKGKYDLKVSVDVNNEIAEENETNNGAQTTIEVSA